MAEQTMYFFRNKENSLYSFYIKNNTLMQKQYFTPMRFEQSTLLENIKSILSLFYNDRTGLFLLCCNTMDDICLIRYLQNGSLETKLLFKNNSSIPADNQYLLMMTDNLLSMVYCLPDKSLTQKYLAYSRLEAGLWTAPQMIDSIQPLQEKSFFATQIREGHIILFYQSVHNTIYARELLISPFTMGTPFTVVKNGGDLIDFSSLIFDDCLHVLYSIKSRNGAKIIYKRKSGKELSSPRILWENAKCANLLVFQADKTIYLSWISNKILYFTQSKDNGNSFTPLQRLKSILPSSMEKGEYLDVLDSLDFSANELYCQHESASIFLHDKFYPKFYPGELKIEQNTSKNYKEDTEVLKNRITILNGENHEKTVQIMEMSKAMDEKNNALTALNTTFRQKTLTLENEIYCLKKEMVTLKKENFQLNNIIEDLISAEK